MLRTIITIECFSCSKIQGKLIELDQSLERVIIDQRCPSCSGQDVHVGLSLQDIKLWMFSKETNG